MSEISPTNRPYAWIAAAVLTAAAGLAFAQPTGAIGEDTLRLHRDADYKGKNQAVNPVTSERPARLHQLHKDLRNKTSSIEWDLPPGVVVILYDNTNGTGRQYVVWGSGRRRALKDANFENRAAAWVWCYLDGWDKAPTHVRNAYAVRPLMTSQSKQRTSPNTLELHKDKGAHDKTKKLLQIPDVTDKPEGALQPVEGPLNNKVSSLRWSLPPGIIVVLYDNANGSGQRLPIWGDGEWSDLRSMSNKISAWAWYNVAAGPGTNKAP